MSTGPENSSSPHSTQMHWLSAVIVAGAPHWRHLISAFRDFRERLIGNHHSVRTAHTVEELSSLS